MARKTGSKMKNKYATIILFVWLFWAFGCQNIPRPEISYVINASEVGNEFYIKHATKVYSSLPYNKGEYVTEGKVGERVKVLEVYKVSTEQTTHDWFQVSFIDNPSPLSGFIHSYVVETLDEKTARLDSAQEISDEDTELIKFYTDLISQGKIVRGMSPIQVEASWGPPKHVNRSHGSYGIREQWVYGDGNYLYFMDGVLNSWQTRRRR